MLPFSVIGGAQVREVLDAAPDDVVTAVRRAYELHHTGDAVNPPSQFLHVPHRPDARIIGLPAYLGGEFDVAGMKWVASFPENISRNVPRASAVLLLNDARTGYPFACLEASQINAARTAASAVLGAEQLAGGRDPRRVALVGCGVIARSILTAMAARGWPVADVRAYDLAPGYADRLVAHARDRLGLAATAAADLGAAVADADVVVLATTAATPYIRDPHLFGPGQVVLNISLRDLDPAVIAAAHNVVDDVDHCLRAGTSVHLTEQALGHRDFVDATLAQLMAGEVRLRDDDAPRIFSPFGLGVLDLAVGLHVYRSVDHPEPVDFFAETTRWA